MFCSHYVPICFVPWLGSPSVAGGLHAWGPVHRTTEKQLQLSVDHQSSQQKNTDRNVKNGKGIPYHCVLVCAKVRNEKMLKNVLPSFLFIHHVCLYVFM